MQLSQLQLKRHYLLSFHISALPIGEKVDSPAIAVNTVPSCAQNVDQPSMWLLGLTVEFKGAEEKKLRYEGTAKVFGIFEVIDTSMSQDQQRKLVSVNGISMLYSSVRETVRVMSALGPHEMLILPTASFADQDFVQGEEPLANDIQEALTASELISYKPAVKDRRKDEATKKAK